MDVDVKFEDTSIEDIFKDDRRAGARAATRTMQKISTFNKNEKRQQIVSSGLGRRLGNTIRSKVYPQTAPSMSASAIIYSNASYMPAFVDGAVIKSKNGFWLAIPTPEAGKGARDKKITPGEWERRTGMRLRFVYRSGTSSLLVADGAKIGKSGRAIANRGGGGSYTRLKGVQTVVIFILVPQVRIRKRLDFKTVDDTTLDMIPDVLLNEWERERYG